MDMKTGEKIIQRGAVELGMYELKTSYTRWHYYHRMATQPHANADLDLPAPKLSGERVTFQKDQAADELLAQVIS